MGRTLTLRAERDVEDAAEAIRVWANDVIDGLYDASGNAHSPARWAEQLPELVAAFAAAAAVCDTAPRSGPNAVH